MSERTSLWSILAIIFAFVFPVVGIIFGVVALVQIHKDSSYGGRGLAIAGIVIGSILLVILPFLLLTAFTSYVGIFSPKAWIPEKCDVGLEFTCEDYFVRTNGISQITLKNTNNYDVTKGTLILEEKCIPGSFDVKKGETIILTCSGTGGESGERYRSTVNLVFTNAENGFERESSGVIMTEYR